MKIIYFTRTCQNRCPRCGVGKILKNIFTRNKSCGVCELEYNREDGFFLGGIPVNYGLICVFWIVPWLFFYMLGLVSAIVAVLVAIIGAIAFAYLGYAYCQCLWLGLYFSFAVSEMPEWTDPIPIKKSTKITKGFK